MGFQHLDQIPNLHPLILTPLAGFRGPLRANLSFLGVAITLPEHKRELPPALR